jgi:hypothetical protein
MAYLRGPIGTRPSAVESSHVYPEDPAAMRLLSRLLCPALIAALLLPALAHASLFGTYRNSARTSAHSPQGARKR